MKSNKLIESEPKSDLFINIDNQIEYLSNEINIYNNENSLIGIDAIANERSLEKEFSVNNILEKRTGGLSKNLVVKTNSNY